jgi:hypothetical protein
MHGPYDDSDLIMRVPQSLDTWRPLHYTVCILLFAYDIAVYRDWKPLGASDLVNKANLVYNFS